MEDRSSPRVSPLQAFGAYLGGMAAHIREAGTMKVVLRALVVWAIDVVALIVMVPILPRIIADSLRVVVVTALAIGLLNALVRPLIRSLAINLPVIVFAVVVFLLNAVVIWLTGTFVPAFELSGLLPVLVASFGLAAITTTLTSLLHINDDDAFYRNVIRRLQLHAAPVSDPDRAGTVIVQIAGLALPVLRCALDEGCMPTLQRWLDAGSHRLVGWDCDVPSSTAAGQAGILWGNNGNIPAFRWYDNELGRLLVSSQPADARVIDERRATGDGLLRDDGSSISSIFTGGAGHTVITISTIVDENGKVTAAPRDVAGFFASPYNLTRLLISSVWEVAKEYYEAWRQLRNQIQPRMHRGGRFPFQRLGTNVLLRDLTLWLVVSDMQRGRLVIYCDLLGYDEVAHRAGPVYVDSLRTLRDIDIQLRAMEKAAQVAPRRYQFVVLSDHGQSWGATFLQRYGITLGQLVKQFITTEETVHQTAGGGEGAGYVAAVLSRMSATGGVVGGSVRRVLGSRVVGGAIDIGQDGADKSAAAAADIVVCGSGNLGLISFPNRPGRLSLELLNATYPELIDGLAIHPGIGWVLVHSEKRGSVVVGKDGTRFLDEDHVEGVDPLAGFAPTTARYLKRLSDYPNAPDIVVNSTLYGRETGEVAAFEERIGCHGGAGGWQTQPFLLFPSSWTEQNPAIEGSEQVHGFLTHHLYGGAPSSTIGAAELDSTPA